MAAPAELAYEEIVQGNSWKPNYTLTSGSTPLDLSATGVDVILRLRPVGGGEAITRRLSGAGETAFVTDGTDGAIQFIFTPAETAALALGWYHLELVYTKDDEDIEITHGRGAIEVTAPRTGADV